MACDGAGSAAGSSSDVHGLESAPVVICSTDPNAVEPQKPVEPQQTLIESAISPTRFSPLTRQILAASGPIMATVAAGMTSGYSAILLPQLKLPDSPIQIDTDQASWIASVAALPMSLGCLISGVLMERYGRRATHLLLCIPFVLGWALIAMSSTIAPLLVGRFLTGLCVGLLGPPCSVYIGETSGPRYRGFLLAAVSLAIALGILLAHIIGTFLHWRLTAAICSAFPFLCYLLMSIVPESPSWLVSHGYPEQAERSFRWLRGCDTESLVELQTLLQTHSMKSSTNKWAQARKASFLKPLIIICIFFVTCQFSGVNAVAFYSVTIIGDALGPSINEYLAMGIVDVVRVVMSVVACVLLRKYGRRPLAVISGIGTSFSLLVLAAYLYLSRNSDNGQAWIPMLSLISYICFISVGIVPLPWAMTGEVFPTALRGLGSGIASALTFIAFFAVVKTGPAMFLNFGQDGTFLTYGTICLLGTIVIYFVLPETKDKTLQEIEDYFVRVKDNDKQEDTSV